MAPSAPTPRDHAQRSACANPATRRCTMAKQMRDFTQGLFDHVGGAPSAVETAMINLAEQLQLRLLCFDAQFVERGGDISGHDSTQYLAWANSLARTLA